MRQYETMSFTTLVRYLKAANPDDVAPLASGVGKLAKMFDTSTENINKVIRDNCIQPMRIGDSGKRYCTLEVWDAIHGTRGQEFPVKGGNKRKADP